MISEEILITELAHIPGHVACLGRLIGSNNGATCTVYRRPQSYDTKIYWKRTRTFSTFTVPSVHLGYAERYAWLYADIRGMLDSIFNEENHTKKTRDTVAQFATETILTHSFFHG